MCNLIIAVFKGLFKDPPEPETVAEKAQIISSILGSSIEPVKGIKVEGRSLGENSGGNGTVSNGNRAIPFLVTPDSPPKIIRIPMTNQTLVISSDEKAEKKGD